MSSVLRPVGPERPTTYWRRRLLAVVVLLVLVVAVVLGVRALTGGDDADQAATTRLDPAQVSPGPLGTPTGSPTGDPTATATGTASPSSSGTADDARPCESGDVSATLTTDATAYGPDATPKLVLTVTNTSDATCTAEIGAGVRTFTATAADGTRVWSTADCQSQGASQVYEIEAGKSRAMSTTWSRQRSAAGCPADQPTVDPGSYTLTGTWDDLTSDPVSISLAG